MATELGPTDDYLDASRNRQWGSTRTTNVRTPSFLPYTELGHYPDNSFVAIPETPATPANRTRLAFEDNFGGGGSESYSSLALALRQEDATLRLLAAYRAHSANLEARLSGAAARPSSTLVRLMDDEDRLRSSNLRLLENEASARIRSPSLRLEVADMITTQKKEAQLLRVAMSGADLRGTTPASLLDAKDNREKDREIESLRQENTRLRAALREETLSLQTRLRELGRAGALLASAPVTTDNEVQHILETDLWSAVNARLQSVIDRRLREEQMKCADLLIEQRQLKAENERLRRDLDAAAALIRRMQTEDLKDYAQLREERELDKRTIEELKVSKDALAGEHDKVAEVCRGLQQLLDSTSALLKRAVGEVDGAAQRAEEAVTLRTKAEEAFAVAQREMQVLRASQATAETSLRETEVRLKEADDRQRVMEQALKEMPLLRAALHTAETAKRESEERAAAELAAGAQRLQEERQRAAVEARALQAKVAFLSKAESAIKESISEVRNTCNVLHTLLSRPEVAVAAQ